MRSRAEGREPDLGRSPRTRWHVGLLEAVIITVVFGVIAAASGTDARRHLLPSWQLGGPGIRHTVDVNVDRVMMKIVGSNKR